VLINEAGNILRYYDDGLDLPDDSPSKRFFQLRLKLGLCNAHYGLMRSAVLHKTVLLGDYPGSDMVFLAELTLHGRFVQLPEYLFFRRMHSEASSSLKTPEELQLFVDPSKHRTVYLERWKHLFEYIKATQRAPLSGWEWLRVMSIILILAGGGRKELLSELQHGFKSLLKWSSLVCNRRE
jgi:hypothetical protein